MRSLLVCLAILFAVGMGCEEPKKRKPDDPIIHTMRWEAGYKARYAGASETANPYLGINSSYASEWLEGWSDAAIEIAKKEKEEKATPEKKQ